MSGPELISLVIDLRVQLLKLELELRETLVAGTSLQAITEIEQRLSSIEYLIKNQYFPPDRR